MCKHAPVCKIRTERRRRRPSLPIPSRVESDSLKCRRLTLFEMIAADSNPQI